MGAMQEASLFHAYIKNVYVVLSLSIALKYIYPVFIQQLKNNNRRENLKLSFAVNFVIFLNPIRLLNILPTFGVDISKTTKKFNIHFKAVALKAVYIPRSVHTKVSITKIKMRECLNQS